MDKDLIDEISKRADIVTVISSYLNVIKKGKNYVAICPFHDDSNPSLQISVERNTFHCFVDGHMGNAISFVMQYEHLPFIDAVKKVAEIIGFDDPRLHENSYQKKISDNLIPLYNCINDLNAYYEYALVTDEGKEAIEYLSKRDINKEIIKKFHIGYSLKDGVKTIKFLQSKGHSLKTIEDIGITLNKGENSRDNNEGRITFAILDSNEQCVGFSARKFKDEEGPKYVNTTETKIFTKGKILYNFYNAKNEAKIKRSIYVLEGFMDVIALSKIGYDNTVALMGTALSKDHIQMLRKLNVEVRLCLDGDKPGQDASMRIVPELLANNISVRIVNNLNDERDPDEIYQEQGKEALEKYLNNLLTPFEFTINYYRNTAKLESAEDKKKLIVRFLPLLISTKSQLEFDDYIYKLAEVTGYSAQAIKRSVINAKNKKIEKDSNIDEIEPSKIISTFHPERKELRRLEKAEREILYHMLSKEDAVKFYEDEIEAFYIDIYREIANFIISSFEEHHNLSINELITTIEMSESKNKDKIKKTLSELMSEKTHLKFNNKLLDNCKKAIEEEKKQIHNANMIIKATEGKSEEEKARIFADNLRNK